MAYDATAIRQLATSRTGGVLAAAEFERVVHLYDLLTLELLRTIDTTLDFGGRRLAISNDGRTVIVGAYRVHGIAAYSGESGEELWRRKDLKKVQHINLNGDDSRVLCGFGFEGGPCESLNAQTGKSGRSLRGVRRAEESPFGPIRFLERARDYAIADAEATIASIPRVSFSALSVAFSPLLVCLSEAAGPVRAFDASSGAELWRHDPPKGIHFLRVGFCEAEGAFVGVSYPYEKGGRPLLQRFAADGASATVLAEVGPAAEFAFALRGERLVTDFGSVFDVPSGRQTGSLPFRDRPFGRP